MQGKNDYDSGGIFYGIFLAPKIKYCLTFNEFGFVTEHETLIGFNGSKRLLNRSQYFRILGGEKVSAMLPISWKNQ